MKAKTMTEQFTTYLEGHGFTTGKVFNSMPLIPTYYKDHNGNHCLVSSIHVCFMGGSNTQPGDLGCVTFCYSGKLRLKGCRTINESFEWFKHAFAPKSATEAIDTFEDWLRKAQAIRETWTKIL